MRWIISLDARRIVERFGGTLPERTDWPPRQWRRPEKQEQEQQEQEVVSVRRPRRLETDKG